MNSKCTNLCLGAYTAGILGQHREAIMSSSTRSTGLGLVTAQVEFRRCTKMGIMVKLVTRSIEWISFGVHLPRFSLRQVCCFNYFYPSLFILVPELLGLHRDVINIQHNLLMYSLARQVRARLFAEFSASLGLLRSEAKVSVKVTAC